MIGGRFERRLRRTGERAVVYALLALLVLYVAFPFFWVVTTSLKPDKYITSRTMYLLPPALTLEHYRTVFTFGHFGRYFFNSTVISLATVALSFVVVVPAAYAISILRVQGGKIISRFILMLQMIPSILIIVPLYIILKNYRLLDTYYGLIVSYATFTIPFCFLLAASYFMSLPQEMFESAFIDGAHSLQILVLIVIPLSAPGLMTTSVYAFLRAWNDFMFANTFTSTATARTLTVEVARLLGVWGTEWGALTAGATVTTLPVLLLFAFAHRYIVEGLTAGAVKG